jgi:Condensation domain
MRKEVERDERYLNCRVFFRLPTGLTSARVRERLRAVVQREEALRVTDLSYSRDRVSWTEKDVEYSVETLVADSCDEAEGIAADMERRLFKRAGGPLWSIALVGHPDAHGRPARSVCGAVDHLITDGQSLEVLRDELLDRRGAMPTTPRVGMSEWVSWQRSEYPLDVTRPTAEREFWLRYLDGTTPESAPRLPFCPDAATSVSGITETVRRILPVTSTCLRLGASRARTTPFVLVLASLVAGVSLVGGDRDVVIRVSRLGRPGKYLCVQGLFADETPVRVVGHSLSDPVEALAAARASWLDVFPHLLAPQYYVIGVHADGLPSTTRRPPQVALNFYPWLIDSPSSVEAPPRRSSGSVTALQLTFMTAADGRCLIESDYDPERFSALGVADFLSVVEGNLSRLVVD